MIRQGGLFMVVGLFFLLQGCAKKNESGPGWGSFPVAIYADPALARDPQAEADLRAAFGFWEGKAGKQLFQYHGEWTGPAPYTGDPGQPSSILANVVLLQSPWPFAPTVAAQTMVVTADSHFEGAMILVNPNTQSCKGDCHGNTGQISEVKVFAHELGHFLGLQHVQDPGNLMYPSMGPGGTLGSVTIDQAGLLALTQ